MGATERRSRRGGGRRSRRRRRRRRRRTSRRRRRRRRRTSRRRRRRRRDEKWTSWRFREGTKRNKWGGKEKKDKGVTGRRLSYIIYSLHLGTTAIPPSSPGSSHITFLPPPHLIKIEHGHVDEGPDLDVAAREGNVAVRGALMVEYRGCEVHGRANVE